MGHTLHSDLDSVDTFPIGHEEQVVGEVCPLFPEKNPSLHLVQEDSLAAPRVGENVPGPHKKHNVPQPDRFM